MFDHSGSVLFRRRSRYVAVVLLAFSSSVFSASFDCTDTGRCGLHGDGPYRHLVVGEVAHVADDAEAETIFQWAREHGYWSTLPDDAAAFPKQIKVVSVVVPGLKRAKGRVTLLMGREHDDAIKIAKGDFVRYVPHGTIPGATPPDASVERDPYWKLFGCIAVLCRAEDTACPSQYHAGIYRVKDGAPLDPNTQAENVEGMRVDPATYRPVTQEEYRQSLKSILR